jgi:hypothetical protein
MMYIRATVVLTVRILAAHHELAPASLLNDTAALRTVPTVLGLVSLVICRRAQGSQPDENHS